MPPVMLTGGTKLANELARISRKVDRANGTKVNVGFLSGATTAGGTSVASIAAWQEFGTPGARFPIPSRPFFRTAIKTHKDSWGKQFGAYLKANDYDSGKALALMGMTIKGQIQESIIDLVAPPLSAVTLMLRKMKANNASLVMSMTQVLRAARAVAAGASYAGVSTKPLIAPNGGVMLNSVDYEVK